MSALLRRELRLLLLSPSGALLLAVWTFLAGALFLVELAAWEQGQQRALQLHDPAVLALLDFNDLLLASVNNHLVVVLLFMGPLLGARLFADGNARDWLLHAAPSTTTLALSKLLAGVVVTGVFVGATLALPIFLAVAGQAGAPAAGGAGGDVVDVGQTLLGAFTLWLAGSSFVAVAAAVSARAGSAVVAALGSFLLLTVLWLVPGAGALAGPDVAAVLAFVSPSGHIEHGLRGVFDLSDVVYFASVFAGCAAACVVALDGERR